MLSSQWDVEFTKDGQVYDEAQVGALLGGLTDATDLLVLSHGWNNDRAEAAALYDELLASLEQVGLPEVGRGSRIAVARLFWPSKKFALTSLIPGGGAASATAENDAALVESLEDLKQDPVRLGEPATSPARVAAVDRAIALVPELDTSLEARREFVLQLRTLLDPAQAHEDDGSREFFERPADDVFERFSDAVILLPTAGAGGAADVGDGGAVFLGDLLSGTRAAARRLANFATYYTMKSRAGVVGRTGVATVLARARQQHPDLPLHLVGHSFGGRLVTAAAASLAPSPTRTSLVLLQAAFSHNGLAERFDGSHDGFFRDVVVGRRVNGPIVITHTKNDLAVGVAYPLASRIARDGAAALGDADDPYGGMGRNGAQHTPEVGTQETVLHPAGPGVGYRFVAGAVSNLLADETIKDHSDVRSPAVATALRDVVTLA